MQAINHHNIEVYSLSFDTTSLGHTCFTQMPLKDPTIPPNPMQISGIPCAQNYKGFLNPIYPYNIPIIALYNPYIPPWRIPDIHYGVIMCSIPGILQRVKDRHYIELEVWTTICCWFRVVIAVILGLYCDTGGENGTRFWGLFGVPGLGVNSQRLSSPYFPLLQTTLCRATPPSSCHGGWPSPA